MGLLDILTGGSGGGDSGAGALYGDALSADQKSALAQRGLLGFLSGMQKSGALNYEAPFLSGRVPAGFAAGLAGGAAGMGEAQDAAGMNALRGLLIGQQGAALKQKLEFQKSFMQDNDKLSAAIAAIMGGGGGSGAAAAPGAGIAAPSATTADNPLALIRHFESKDQYNVGFGGTDLSSAPKDEYGFPIWEGKSFTDKDGKLKQTHAAGAYQFQPATWAQYAKPLGIKDFSAESQDAVARAAYLDQGFKPWAPYNPRLAAAIGGGNGAPIGPIGGVDVVTGGGQIGATGEGANARLVNMASGAPVGAGGPLSPATSMPALAASGPLAPSAAAPGADQAKVQALLLALAGKNAGAEVLGMGNPYNSYLSVLQGSPGYKGAIKGAETAADRAITEPSDIRIKAAEQALTGAREKDVAANAPQKLGPTETLILPPGSPGAQRFAGAPQPGAAPAPDGSVRVTGSNEPSFANELAQQNAKAFMERFTVAKDAQKSLENSSEARKLLDQGLYATGAGANLWQSFGRGLQGVGYHAKDEPLANAEAYMATRAMEVGRLIKQFGSGTGLSDADRQYAAKMAAGDISLTKEAIIKIMDISDRASRNVIGQHNSEASKVPSQLSPYPLTVDLPPAYQKPQLKPLDAGTRTGAQSAIMKGAPRDAVIQRLREGGYDTSGF